MTQKWKGKPQQGIFSCFHYVNKRRAHCVSGQDTHDVCFLVCSSTTSFALPHLSIFNGQSATRPSKHSAPRLQQDAAQGKCPVPHTFLLKPSHLKHYWNRQALLSIMLSFCFVLACTFTPFCAGQYVLGKSTYEQALAVPQWQEVARSVRKPRGITQRKSHWCPSIANLCPAHYRDPNTWKIHWATQDRHFYLFITVEAHDQQTFIHSAAFHKISHKMMFVALD